MNLTEKMAHSQRRKWRTISGENGRTALEPGKMAQKSAEKWPKITPPPRFSSFFANNVN